MALTIEEVELRYLQPASSLALSGAALQLPRLATVLETYFGADSLALTNVTPSSSALTLVATTVLPAAGGGAGATLPVTVTFVPDSAGATLAALDIAVGPASSLSTLVWTLPPTLITQLTATALTLRLRGGTTGSELVALAVPLLGPTPLRLLLDATTLYCPSVAGDRHELTSFNGAAAFANLLPSFGAAAGWSVEAQANFDPRPPLSLGAVMGDLAQRFGVTLPWTQSALALNTLTFSCGSTQKITFGFGSVLTLGDASRLDATLTLTANARSGFASALAGTVTIDGTTFALDAAQGQSVDLSLASAAGVTLSTVAGWCGIALSPNVGPAVHTVRLRHDLAGKRNGFFAASDRITATGANDGTHTLVTIGVHLGLTFAYSGLTFPGLSGELDFGVTGVELIVANTDLDAVALTALGTLLPPGTTFAASAPVHQGRTLSASLLLGKDTRTLSIGVGGGSTGSATASVRVEKQIGPVHVGRLGIGYSDGTVTLTIDGGFNLSGLDLDFEGLQLHGTFTAGITGFDLNGLALSFQRTAFTIAGEFLEAHDPAYDGGRAFSGAAVLAAETLTVAAAGGWGTIRGAPSLFVYGQFDKPLGGPPFFFVRGVSAAFGLNRSLIVPPVTGLTTFPLVQAAMADANNPNPLAGKSPVQVLTSLESSIQPAYGEKWAAAGVRFTSFGVIEGFALVVVRFGKSITFQLLGVGATSLPKGAPKPLAYAEIPVEITVDPSAGSVVALARLAPSSFVLDPACHLRGGFAFAAWFKDDPSTGATAGDFVYSIGGYHPAFKAPTHYPSVPRLSAMWQSGHLTIDGTYYYAVTPSALMAGGSLQAVWERGSLRAWFNADADFLISWRPFAYDAHVGINVGASFTIDLLFTSVDITIHVGVDMHFWGPPFQGEARIDLDIISFTISFGASGTTAEQQPISWSEFKAGFFPPRSDDAPPPALHALRGGADAQFAAATPAPIPTVDVSLCRARVSKGLLSTLTPVAGDTSSPDWVVNGAVFELTTESAIPATAAFLVTGDVPVSTPIPVSWSTGTFGVGPVGVPNGMLFSEHTISLRGIDPAPRDPTPSLVVTPVIGAVPASAWSVALAQRPSTATINGSPATIANTLLGFRIAPKSGPSDVGLPQPLPIARLEFENDPHPLHWAWTAPAVPASTTHPQAQATARVTATLEHPAVVRRREAIIAAARAAGLSVTAGAQLTRMAQTFTNAAPPLLRALGEL